ncbi:MAG TPA: HAD family hydrolase [Vicinamibacterales bacterium]
MSKAVTTVLFDVDGTLVDSNDAHAAAWVKAFTESGVRVDPSLVRRCIGMGGDKLMPAVSGIDAESEQGSAIAKRRGEIFSTEFLPSLEPFRDADRLVAAVRARGLTVVVASSAKDDELQALLKIAGAAGLVHASTSADDADESKPAPDIVEAALNEANAAPADAIMIGDTPYDIEAASRAGVRAIALRSGGWSDRDLAGAIAIYDGTWDLLAQIDDSALTSRDAI